MAVRVDYHVRILPDDYVTKVTEYGFVDDDKAAPDRFGRKRQKMVAKEVEIRGGVLVLVKGKPGHSLRLTSLEQALDFKLIDYDQYVELKAGAGLQGLRPRLVDMNTGEYVNEQGVPLNIARELEEGTTMPKHAGRSARGRVDTDIDVNTTGDEDFSDIEMPPEAGHEHVDKMIDKVE